MPISEPGKTKPVMLHMKDILELSDLMDGVVLALIYKDLRFDDDGKPSGLEPFTHEYALQRLHNVEHAKETPFFVFGGKWQGRPYSDYVYGEDDEPQTMRDKYLLPYKDQIVNLSHSKAAEERRELGKDITDDFLLDLFTVKWEKLLEQFADAAEWRSEHGLPTRMPGRYDDGSCWYVWVDGRLEVGPLEYVAAEYCRSGLCYCFDCKRTNPDFPDYQDHAHSFEGVLQAALENPEEFTLKGFEKDYSEQEREFLKKFVKKLRQDKKENYPHRVHADRQDNTDK